MASQLTYLVLAMVCITVVSAAPSTVKDVDVIAYLGRWYQTHSNRYSDQFAGIKDSECTTATYGAINATFVSVYNAFARRDGTQADEINGYAFIPDPREPGKLLVVLEGVPIEAPYWILDLGPIVDNQYEYSIISDQAGLGLFVLARDVPRFEALYEAEVETFLFNNGFTGGRSAIKEYHGSDCEYPPFPLPDMK